jgi:hypothetical protein
VSGGCRADFQVTSIAGGQGDVATASQGGGAATPTQLRACRIEADRRLPGYTYQQIRVEPESREGNASWVRWEAANSGGRCLVEANGRILQFTTDGTGGDVGGGEVPTAATRITCESRGTGRQECPVPDGAEIRLVRQLSQSPCRLNDTYGKGAGYVWVAEGCRGEFEVARGGVSGGTGETVQRITCQSQGAVRQRCAVPGATQMRLVRQLSTSPCRRDQTYGIGSGDIWVSNGCRGEFDVTVAGAPGDGSGLPGSPGLANRVTCESKAGERAECRIRNGGQVELVRQLSSAACTRNSTWGTRYGVLWVARGCRGEFEVR